MVFLRADAPNSSLKFGIRIRSNWRKVNFLLLQASFIECGSLVSRSFAARGDKALKPVQSTQASSFNGSGSTGNQPLSA